MDYRLFIIMGVALVLCVYGIIMLCTARKEKMQYSSEPVTRVMSREERDALPRCVAATDEQAVPLCVLHGGLELRAARRRTLLATQVLILERITEVFTLGPARARLLDKWMDVLHYLTEEIRNN